MVDYSWFRLLVKGIGVLLVGLAVPELFYLAVRIGRLFTQAAPANAAWWNETLTREVGWGLGLCAQLGFGFYLLLGGNALVERCLRDVYGRCPSCGYDVRQTPDAKCPECGTVLPGRTLSAGGDSGVQATGTGGQEGTEVASAKDAAE